jgi:8-oxo-dGTP diphosphatase
MSRRLRHSVRALIVDDDSRVLLCRFRLQDEGIDLWTTPGGGVEVGETPLQALYRELDEEVGLAVDAPPAWIWHQEIVDPSHAVGYDGVLTDTYLVRVSEFDASGSLGADALRDEGIEGLRWWTTVELLDYDGSAIFGPRDLGRRVTELLDAGVPASPLKFGL